MKRLADISAFEQLQNQANQSFFEVSVFNGICTRSVMAEVERTRRFGSPEDMVRYVASALVSKLSSADSSFADTLGSERTLRLECRDLARSLNNMFAKNKTLKYFQIPNLESLLFQQALNLFRR